ncbi:MAG: lysine biosynthesis protein LysX [Thermoplasmata archaeon]|nr:MAG: lysine biosynthesis protein LysX [Thermoplasmata archaeon]
MHIGMLYSRIRLEEKWLLEAARKRDIQVTKIKDDDVHFELDSHNGKDWEKLDVVLERCISHSRAFYALRFFEQYGIPTVNRFEVCRMCGDKALTSLALASNKIPTPRTSIVFSRDAALDVMEKMGYPVVMKPVVGSWGRLMAKIETREMAESILEHKSVLGNYLHSIFYIQEYIEKPQRDIRTFVLGDEVIAGIYRNSKHWITNTALGATVSNCPLDDELNELSLRAAKAVGGGAIAIDLMEVEGGYTVNEVNYTMEFKNSVEPTGVDIPAKFIDYIVSVAKS